MNKLRLAKFFLFFFRLIPLRNKLRSNQKAQPFFVFGSGRNGSTLLNRILNESSQLFLPPEQYFLGPIIFKFHFYNYLLWNDLAKVIVGEIFLKDKETWDFDPTPALIQAAKLTKQDRSLQSIVNITFNAYGKQLGKGVRWGDTTSPNTKYGREIFKLFPKAKFVFLIRDGRDVVASYKTAGEEAFGENSQIEKSTEKWLDSIKQYEWLKKRTEVLLVKYEDLVRDTENTLLEICTFLQVEEIPSWENYIHNIPSSKFYSQGYLERTKEQVFSESIGRWEKVLTDEEKVYANSKMERKLTAFGYNNQNLETK